MITSENIKFYFEDLTESQVNEAMESQGDYLVMSLSIFNAGAVAMLEPYDEIEHADCEHDGSIKVCKEEFLLIFELEDCINPFITKWL